MGTGADMSDTPRTVVSSTPVVDPKKAEILVDALTAAMKSTLLLHTRDFINFVAAEFDVRGIQMIREEDNGNEDKTTRSSA